VASEIARSDASVHEAEADLWLGVMEVDSGRGLDPSASFDKVLSALDRALASDSAAKSTHSKRALAYIRLMIWQFNSGGDPSPLFEAAIKASRQAVIADPGDATAHDNMGGLFYVIVQNDLKLGRDPSPSFDSGIKSFNDAIRADPNFAWAWNDLGAITSLKADFEATHGRNPLDLTERAIESYKRAIAINPSYLYAYGNLCDSYWKKGIYELNRGVAPDASWTQAIEACNAALKLNPRYSLIWGNLGLVHISWLEHSMVSGAETRSTLEATKDVLARAVELNPSRVEWLQSLTDVHRLEVLKALEQRASPRDILVKAEATLQRLRELAPSDATTHLIAGRLELVTARAMSARGEDPARHFAAARAAFEEASRLKPNSAEIYHAAAELSRREAEWHVERRKNPQALKLAAGGLDETQKSLVINPGMPAVIATSGALHLIRARAAGSPADRAAAARLAETSLDEAIRANQFLKREYEPLLAEAKTLAAASTPP
jgi:tetratricopeptide (TPR) repeat protein